MSRIQWARTSQFNWVFDNMGGTRLQEAAAGNWSGIYAQVREDNQVWIESPNPGGGQVFYLRGIWLSSTIFPWNGFWAEPERGDLTNYYSGGSFLNKGSRTIATLGASLAPGTEVQLFYVYFTGSQSEQYEPLNSYPCIRPAFRERLDYSYDFAVDRILDLMVLLDFAARERGHDYTPMIGFLWESFYSRNTSLKSPLIMDTFERGRWDKGSYLLYYNSTCQAEGFRKFAIGLYSEDNEVKVEGEGQQNTTGNRALQMELPDFQGSAFSAWWGYGLNWDLTASPFAEINRVSFKLAGKGASSRVQLPLKVGAGGAATLIIEDNYNSSEPLDYLLKITTGGRIGTARFTWQIWNLQQELVTEQLEMVTAGLEMPLTLPHGLRIWWEPGTGLDFVTGDYWSFRCGRPSYHPRRLQVVLNDSAPEDTDPWGVSHNYVHAAPDRFRDLTSYNIGFDQFWRLDNLVDDRDRRRGQWGSWYTTSGQGGQQGIIELDDREETEIIDGKTFYTQQKAVWNLPNTATALGIWVGVDTAQVNSSGYADLNLALKPLLSSGNGLTVRIKVKDAQGSYFFRDYGVANLAWNRVQVDFTELMPESGGVLMHPIEVVEVGMSGSPVPGDGTFLITDVKFGNHRTFAGSTRLRVLEFKYQELPVVLGSTPNWWLDDIGLNLESADPYPYVPRLAISLGPYGQNAWRGPTLVHYAHPLAPYLINRLDLKDTYLQLHRDAQDTYHNKYGGLKGPIMPVHGRNDIENIAILGEQHFGKFCWWPDYPETTHALGQYWAFYRLAEYYFSSQDAGAWAILSNWLAWFDTYVVADGPGWKFPLKFSDAGISYDTDNYCPGSAASIAIGMIYIYMRNGNNLANIWARRILDDLRQYRVSGDYGGYAYKSDYHYGWLNALVAHAFGLAITGRAGMAYAFSVTSLDITHFEALIDWMFQNSGNRKPALLNADLIPFSYLEDEDVWDYAPHYLFMRQMGSMEAVVLMLGTAMDYGKHTGDWSWFDRLLKFMIVDNLVVLDEPQLREVEVTYDLTNLKNLIRVRYADYDRDNDKYIQVQKAAMVAESGELPLDLDLRYGRQVVTEDPQTVLLLAQRLLARQSIPREIAQVETWLEGTRLELGDTVAVSSPFHGYDRSEFQCAGKTLSLDQQRVRLQLVRRMSYDPAWAVDSSGTDYDSYAIGQNSSGDPDWVDRANIS